MPKFTSSKHHIQKKKLQSPYLEKHLQGKIGRYTKDRIEEFKEAKKTDPSLAGLGGAMEVKLVTGGTLAFSKFEDQQLPSLVKVKHEGLYHKLTDASVGCKPFDYFVMYGEAYVICQFWKNKQQEICYFLDIDKVMEIKKSGAKSLKEEDFFKWGHVINLSSYK